MGIKELLENIKLIDLQVKVKDFLKGGQVGLVNITVEKNITINVQSGSTFWEKFSASPLTPEIEKQARQISEEKLECIASELDLLPRDIVLNVATATMATSAMQYITHDIDVKEKKI